MKLSKQFKQILDDEKSTETDAMRFIKSYPMLMVRLFNVSWNYYRVFPEFQLGTEYRADFMVLSADSGSWHSVFIELEGPNDQIYLKKGGPAKKLRAAQLQISDWQKYVRAHGDTVKQEIARRLKKRRVIAQNKLMGKGGWAHDEILLPDVFVWDSYKIMLGQRKSFDDEPELHMPAPGAGYSPQISTYDRVHDLLVKMEADRYINELEEFLTHDDLYSVCDIQH